MMSGIFNIGMQFETIGGNRYIRIEPASYFYTATPVLTITNIKDVKKSHKEDQLSAAWKIGAPPQNPTESEGSRNNRVAPWNENSVTLYTVDYSGCPGIYDLTEETRLIWGVGWSLYLDLTTPVLPLTTVDQEKTFYFITGSMGGTITHFPIYRFDSAGIRFMHWTNYDSVHSTPYTYINRRFDMPSHYIPQYYSWYWYDNGPGMQCGAGIINFCNSFNSTFGTQTIAAGAGFAPVIWEFTRFISFAEFSAIINSQQITLNQGSDPANDVNAFIEEVEFRIFDGETKFKMSAST